MNQPKGACACCGRRYGSQYGFPDLMIPDWAWKRISPRRTEGGLLCPSCICRLLHEQGIKCEGVFKSGPLAVEEDLVIPHNCSMCCHGKKDGEKFICCHQVIEIEYPESTHCSSFFPNYIDPKEFENGK